MKKQYFAIAASLLLSLSMGSIAMAQDIPTSAKNNTEAKAVSTEISTTPVPYRPDVKVENSGKTIYGYVSADYVTCSNGRIAHTENVMDNLDLLQH